MRTPARPAASDLVGHHLMPTVRMRALDIRPCETDANRPEPHDAVQIIDPEGAEDWLCAYDLLVVNA